MNSLKSNFIKLGIVLTMVVVLLVTLSMLLATSYYNATGAQFESNQNNAIGFQGGPIPAPTHINRAY